MKAASLKKKRRTQICEFTRLRLRERYNRSMYTSGHEISVVDVVVPAGEFGEVDDVSVVVISPVVSIQFSDVVVVSTRSGVDELRSVVVGELEPSSVEMEAISVDSGVISVVDVVLSSFDLEVSSVVDIVGVGGISVVAVGTPTEVAVDALIVCVGWGEVSVTGVALSSSVGAEVIAVDGAAISVDEPFSSFQSLAASTSRQENI